MEKNVDRYLEAHLDESLKELSRLCAQPSVSAQNWGLQECADLVARMLSQRGFEVNVHPTDGAPIVTGYRPGRSQKTLLFYNHYDVQPVEPLELWDTPPFVPTIKDGRLYARGASDDKGQFVSRLFAIDALLSELGELPCGVRFLLEGEEETSSANLKPFVNAHVEELRADACVWEFGGVDFRGMPMQYLGLRGICYVELSVQTASQDVHSGLGGSIFPNAAWRLVWALSTLKDSRENILIPGFYEDVVPPTERDRELMAALPDEAHEFHQRYGVERFLRGTSGGLELAIQQVFEPTCTICGLTSGYQGIGAKTVLPAAASAKVDFRLVPNQRPEKVFQLLREHLDAQGFGDVQLTMLGGETPCRTNPDDPFVAMVIQTSQEVYGQPMQIVPLVGGSGPNHVISEALQIPIVTAGAGSPEDQAHAPNENLQIDLYLKAARHVARILQSFADD